MLLRLFLLFTLVPVLELALLIQIGTVIGPLWTIAIVVTTGFAGAWLSRREGFAVLRQLQQELQHGIPPGAKIVEGALVLAGALLLVTPGVFTDVAGLLFIIPPSRRFLAPRILGWLLHRFRIDVQQVAGEPVDEDGVWTKPSRQPQSLPAEDAPFDHPIPEDT
ncbi:MAG: FxsA family protein [Deltaproteobacteria bacterium]|nr:FxsA family protein [Deltaproteobacteria bacterium]MBW2254436.1 FxsA family protein [Deltaproteobacteria bacterium]